LLVWVLTSSRVFVLFSLAEYWENISFLGESSLKVIAFLNFIFYPIDYVDYSVSSLIILYLLFWNNWHFMDSIFTRGIGLADLDEEDLALKPSLKWDSGLMLFMF